MQSQQSENGDNLYSAFFSLISYARQIDTSAQKWFEERGDKPNLNQWGVMHFLHYHNGSSQLEIAEFINRDAATITRMIDQMSEDGFVERTQNQNDRRKWKVSLTEKGELQYKEIEQLTATLISTTFIGIHKEEIQKIVKALDQISKNIKI